jgi:hypothetical protein
MKRVAILGCGPAGLLAAHAASIAHVDSQIFAVKQPSVINGAQFIHEPIAMLDVGDPSTVHYTKQGAREGYATKVYGDPNAPCSWDLLPEGDHPAWPMLGIYELLWELYAGDVHDKRIYPHDLRPLEEQYDLVICTIPRMTLCLRKHSFASVRVFFSDRSTFGAMPNFIEYDGRESVEHYRKSRLFGHESLEFGDHAERHREGLRAGVKPLSTSCNCHPKTLFVGRFGKWQKGQLVHHAFQDALKALQEL